MDNGVALWLMNNTETVTDKSLLTTPTSVYDVAEIMSRAAQPE